MKYKFIPISMINSTTLLIFKHNKFYLFNKVEDSYEFICDLPTKSFQKLVNYCKLTARFFRLVNFVSAKINESNIIIAFNSKVYLISIFEKRIDFLFKLDKGKRPLSFCNVPNNHFIKEGIYYGDYCGNSDKDEINIYRIDKISYHKQVVYTFKKGEVNHIHNILFDSYNNCLWIFSGDFDKSAAIWQVKDDFKQITPILRDNQKYRSCVAFCNNGEIIYATDTPFQQNSLRKLMYINNKWITKSISDIKGSVIYGSSQKNKLIFSTVVESNGIYRNKWEMITCNKRGNGISDNYTHLYTYNIETNKLDEIYKQEKDIFPYALFQFGVLIFPSGDLTGESIPVFNIATKQNDLCTKYIDLR